VGATLRSSSPGNSYASVSIYSLTRICQRPLVLNDEYVVLVADAQLQSTFDQLLLADITEAISVAYSEA
jgi:hypothetical protein